MSEMVEKVARAMADADIKTAAVRHPGLPRDALTASADAIYGDYIVMARAAIGAMREPTVAMHKAGTIRDDGADPTNAKGVYSVMIDAALKEGGEA